MIPDSINMEVTLPDAIEPLATLASLRAGEIVHSESSPASVSSELALSEGSGTDSDCDFDDLPTTPLLTWAAAAQDALEGIQYVREKFPNDNTTFLPGPFRREPLSIEQGDKVVILDEVSEHAIRVKLLRTDAIGVIPAWNVEDPLERLARQNMELNEIVTCPAEVEAQTDDALAPNYSMSHIHDRCAPQAKRRVLMRRYSTDEDLDSDFPLTPTCPVASFPRRTQASSSKPRKVGFTDISQKTIFRYFPPHDDSEEQWDSDSDQAEEDGEGALGDREDDGDSKWWWDGWEEKHEASDSDVQNESDCDSDEDHDAVTRLGRPRVCSQQHAFSVEL